MWVCCVLQTGCKDDGVHYPDGRAERMIVLIAQVDRGRGSRELSTMTLQPAGLRCVMLVDTSPGCQQD